MAKKLTTKNGEAQDAESYCEEHDRLYIGECPECEES